MMRTIAKSKLHGLRVTATDLNYGGSLTLDADLLKAADLVAGERVQVVNLNNGHRLETYVIEGPAGSGECILNGPAALRGSPGDIVHVISYGLYPDGEDTRGLPKSVVVDESNRPLPG
ncbi:MAG: aspartate 1-decarboxylase [Armatimonadetes bacterium]|nr:aspartate 1-decarboxylase [Armatimonadota bacterium]